MRRIPGLLLGPDGLLVKWLQWRLEKRRQRERKKKAEYMVLHLKPRTRERK